MAVFTFTIKCPACGDDADLCEGHTMFSNFFAVRVQTMHDSGDHRWCAAACKEVPGCPDCNGTGTIAVDVERDPSTGAYDYDEADCPVCN